MRKIFLIFCLWCLIDNWGELPWWIALGLTQDCVAASEEEETSLCNVIEECETKTKMIRSLKTYAQSHENVCGEYFWDIQYLCDVCLNLYAELYKVAEDSREEGIEKNKHKLKALGHILWHNCTVLNNIMDRLGIEMADIEKEKL